MVDFIIHHTVKNYQDKRNNETRSAIGRVLGIIGILCNIFLFGIKFMIGIIVNSISIQADALNNLSDAFSNIISIVSFYISSRPADKEHPFGHERTEVIASLFVSLIVGFLGLSTMKESIVKIIHPGDITFRSITVLILLISLAVKFWMYTYNKRYAREYDSSLLEAAAVDSISDVIGTSAVLLSTMLSPFLNFDLDGYMGIIVSIMILYNAYNLLKEVLNKLIGEAPDPDLVAKLETMIKADELVLGIHDLIIHDYGPDQIFASVHVEVDENESINHIHEHIDEIERMVQKQMLIHLVIHMDPIKVNDPETDLYKDKIEAAIKQCDNDWSFHDFRIVSGDKKVNLIFDLVIPFNDKRSKADIEKLLMQNLYSDKRIFLTLTIEHSYI